MSLLFQIQVGLTLAGCAFALLFGLWPERATGVAYLAAATLGILLQDHTPASPDYAVLAVDVALLIVMAWVHLKSRRIWTGAFAAFVLLAVGTHVAVIADNGLRDLAYSTAQNVWAYGGLVALVLGVCLEALPLRRAQARRRRLSA